MSIDPEDFKPLPILDQRTAAARAEAEALLDQANKMHADAQAEAEHIRAEARDLRIRTLAAATDEANRVRDAAKAETEQRKQRDDKLDTWAARGVIAGAVGLTASGEYSLARMAGFDQTVAWLLPFVIDVYVIQAFRRHRDIVQAIALTVAANVTYHLADAGLFGVTAKKDPTWWLIALVASVASFILWRMHLMVRPPKPAKSRQDRRQEERQETAVVPQTPAPATAPAVDSTTAKTIANSDRQEAPSGAAKSRQEEPAKKAAPVAKKPAQTRRQNTAKSSAKKPAGARRSMDEWVALTEPIFHAEFAQLRRNPTASEFANAIAEAGHGKPSDSTAKNIRTEILDRAELPSLDGTE